MLPIRRRLYQSQPGFSPRQIFAALQGAWLEPIQGSIWQENTGVTPTTTGGQTLGLMLDQSQGAVLGPELVSNGDFADGTTTGWFNALSGPTIANVGGRLRLSSTTAASKYAGYTLSVVSGAAYTVSIDYWVNVSFGIIGLGNTSPPNNLYSFNTGPSISGTHKFTWISTVTGNITLALRVADTGFNEYDNVSVRKILGNHASQSTAANRPTYQLDSNNLPLTRHDTTDSLVVNLPNLGSGVYSASGSVYFATPQGMSALHNQSMATTYTLPALSTDIYSWIVVPQRLNTALEGRLERYMLRKAGLATPDYLTDDLGEILTDDIGDPLLAG